LDEAAGGVLTAKQAPHRPDTDPAHGLRAERAVVILPQTTKETTMNPFSFRPQVEQLDGRCLPSANPATTIGGAALGNPPALAHASAPPQQPVPIRLSTHITSDGSGVLSFTGSGSYLGRWTGQGVVVETPGDQGAIVGTATFTAANGDQLFASFAVSLDLAEQLADVTITFTGGTGRFAGASGRASQLCHVNGDPTSTLAFECDGVGSGTLVFDHSR
jgi:hypothetical protein